MDYLDFHGLLPDRFVRSGPVRSGPHFDFVLSLIFSQIVLGHIYTGVLF